MLQSCYLALPAPLQTAAISVLGGRNRFARYGREFKDHRGFLREAENWPKKRMDDWQREELFSLLTHSLSTVPRFRELRPNRPFRSYDAWRILADLPFLTKEEIRQDPQRFTSDKFRPRDLLPVVTSGTSGSPMRFLIDKRSRQEHFAYFDRLLRWAKLDPEAWHGVFMGKILGREEQLNARPWRTDLINRRVYFSSYHITRENVTRYVEGLQRKSLKWVEGYPSAIGNLARLVLQQGIDLPRPLPVIPSSEILDSPTRDDITEAFGDAIWEFYAAAEQAAFISQCEARALHVNPEYGIVEFDPKGSDEDGEPLYELVATSFRNRAMPLVRYRTGDLVTLVASACDCGRPFPVVERIVGRDSGSVVLPDGRRVTGISNVPKGLPIEQSQLVQLETGEIEFMVVPNPASWHPATENELMRRLRDRLGGSVDVRIRLVDSIPPGPNGKHALVRRA